MARNREFSEETVLDATMEAFWKHGYEATSMSDLMAATGLTKGSIYKAFGSKHELFLLALERYLRKTFEQHQQALSLNGAPSRALEEWFRVMIDFTESTGKVHMGCLAVNSGIELGPHDEEVKGLLGAQLSHALELFVARLAEGQRLGEFRQDIEPQDLAMLLIIFHIGTLASLRTILSTEEAQRLAAKMLQLIAA